MSKDEYLEDSLRGCLLNLKAIALIDKLFSRLRHMLNCSIRNPPNVNASSASNLI